MNNSKVLIGLYLVAIIAANLLVVKFGPGMSVVNAFLFIGLDLSTRDSLHEAWHGNKLWSKMALLIATGSILSYVLNRDAGRIAIASFVAFAASGATDAITYALLGGRQKLVKMNGSNLVSAAVDSFTFPAIAFGFPLMFGVMIGQFIAKVGGGFMWSLVLTRGDRARYASIDTV